MKLYFVNTFFNINIYIYAILICLNLTIFIFLKIGSVIAPRKMIDIETNDFAPSTTTTTTTNRVIVAQKNSKQILLEIEHVSFSKIL